jgi:hypothetical protein
VLYYKRERLGDYYNLAKLLSPPHARFFVLHTVAMNVDLSSCPFRTEKNGSWMMHNNCTKGWAFFSWDQHVHIGDTKILPHVSTPPHLIYVRGTKMKINVINLSPAIPAPPPDWSGRSENRVYAADKKGAIPTTMVTTQPGAYTQLFHVAFIIFEVFRLAL